MSANRLKSIVPMYGGATRYVETLNDVLDFVRAHNPTTDELIGWHRGSFPQVSSRDSIMRRVQYIQQVGFIDQKDNQWTIDDLGNEYLKERDMEQLLEIMCDRNVGLRSLLYELSSGPMTLKEINKQQLDTHPELGWNQDKTDMAKQRVNWLRSMDAVERTDDNYRLTDQGISFISQAIGEWANAEQLTSVEDEFETGTYETTIQARAVDPEFRASALSRYEHECPISGVDHPRLLDVAHVLSWSEYPDHRADLSNVVVLSKTHHAAFDQGLRNCFRIWSVSVAFSMKRYNTNTATSIFVHYQYIIRTMTELTLDVDDGNLFFINGEETIEKEVKPQGNGAHVIVPKRWTGAQVKITRISDPDEDEDE